MKPMVEAVPRFLRARGLVAILAASSAGLVGCGDYYDDARAPEQPPAQPTYDYAQQPDPAQQQIQAQANAGDQFQDADPSALQDFREPLAPYGAWVEDPNYGTVWIPDASVVGQDFAPYQTAGHWAEDDDNEFLWVSDYDWGYIPFHYGRWTYLNNRGWGWIPGRTYSPAWVTWRTGDAGYIGWAPLPPSWYWYDGYPVGLWVVPPAPFVFCSTAYVFNNHVGGYIVHDRGVVHTAAGSTRPYKPSTPSIGHGDGRPSPQRRSPSLGEAHVAATSDIPRASGNARALAYSSPTAMTAARANGVIPASHATYSRNPSAGRVFNPRAEASFRGAPSRSITISGHGNEVGHVGTANMTRGFHGGAIHTPQAIHTPSNFGGVPHYGGPPSFSGSHVGGGAFHGPTHTSSSHVSAPAHIGSGHVGGGHSGGGHHR